MSSINRHILIVDDNRAIHDDFRKILCPEQRGKKAVAADESALFGEAKRQEPEPAFELDFAYQGQEALELVSRACNQGRPYAMAFIDVRMPPGWDGVETVQRIWEVDPDLQVVICTAYSDYSWDEMMSKIGPSDRLLILRKPFDVVEVMQLVHALTQKWWLLQQTRQNLQLLEDRVQDRTRELTAEIAQRQRAEEAMQQIAAIVESSDDAIIGITLDGVITSWNLGAQKVFGYSAQEAIDKPVLMLIPPERANEESDILERVKRGESVDHFETVRVRRSGERIDVSVAISPIKDSHGRIVGASKIARDITARKRTEDQLRKLSRALEQSPAYILITDAAGQIEYVNPRFTEVTGYTLAEVEGKNPRVLKSGQTPPQVYQDLWQTITRGGEWHGEFCNRRKNGELYWEATSICPLSEDDGRITHFLAVNEEITERKQAEQKRAALEVQLRQSQKVEAIGQLAAGIAHEINTPTQYVGDNTRFLEDSFASIAKVLQAYEELLCAAKNHAVTPELLARVEQLLETSDLAYLFEQIPAAIKETLEGVGRVTKIVRAMKEFSHPGGKEKAAANLNKAIETTVTVARNEWKYVADMELDLDPTLPDVPCFVGEFNQCILNLVVNAAHAIGDVLKQRPGTKGTITVRTRREGDCVEVRVSDTGTGIPESARPRIFEPFFTTKGVGKGTGQGLSIVYGSIVKKHGGTVSFETEVGKGTTFILRLPITPRTAEGESCKSDSASCGQHTQEQVSAPMTQ